jgi:uroporphyrinogen decarboxylase
MKDRHSHRDNIQMVLAGEQPERFLASFWRHFFHREHDAARTADAMVAFQQEFDWDFMKINPRADYHVQDWGVRLEYSTNELEKHAKSQFPVTSVEDWGKITVLPTTAPALAEHLDTVSRIRRAVGPDLPILMTVFTPLSVAGRLVADQQTLIDHLTTAPERVAGALAAITETYAAFAAELRNAGADGLFYATTQWASQSHTTWPQYELFGLPYDLKVIHAAGEDALNLLHVCDCENYLKQLAGHDYRAAMFNWDSQHPTNPSLEEGLSILKSAVVVGGVDQQGWLRHGTAEEVGYKIDELKERFDPSRLIIGPGCSMPPEVPKENLHAIRERL